MSWRPLLDTESARQALGMVAEVVEACRVSTARDANACVGRALLFHHAALRGVAGADELLDPELQHAIEHVLARPLALSLMDGMLGVAWTVAHLTDSNAVAAFDRSIAAGVTQWTGPYDLVHGLAGVGVYALERIETTAGVDLAHAVLDHLEATALCEGVALTWRSPEAVVRPAGKDPNRVDLGVAHGVFGVVGLLARFIAQDVEVARARRLLDGALALLPDLPARGASRIPAFLPPPDRDARRLGWCYCDPGAAITLFAAGRATARADWERIALEIAVGMLDQSFETMGVTDPCLCHGSAGVMHILNRLYQTTGDEILGAAARTWFARTLELAGDELEWRSDQGLLNGAPGVALALLAAITEIEPTWDRLLLCDL